MKIIDERNFILERNFFEVFLKQCTALCKRLNLNSESQLNIVFAQFNLKVLETENKTDTTCYLFNKIHLLSNKYGEIQNEIHHDLFNICIDSNSSHIDASNQAGKCIRDFLNSYYDGRDSYDSFHITLIPAQKSLTFNAFFIEYNKNFLGLDISADTKFLHNVFSSLFYATHSSYGNRTNNIMPFYDKITYDINKNIGDVIRDAGLATLNNQLYKEFKKDKYKDLNLFEIFNTLSFDKYEGSQNIGKIIFTSSTDNFDYKMKINKPIDLNNLRSVRKLLEIAKEDYYLLCDGEYITGIVKLSKNNISSTRSFKVIFKQEGIWEVTTVNNKVIMRVKNGVPGLSEKSFDKQDFKSVFTNVFTKYEYEEVWNVIENAKEQEHGTILVIRDRITEETIRLDNQCIPVTPESHSNLDIIKHITSIDGAVLLDPNGRFHAIGMILDGMAIEGNLGDISRGSRYNSAIRYLASLREEINCLIVVISEDGTIDMLSRKI